MLACDASSLPLWRRQKKCFFRQEEEPCSCSKPVSEQLLGPTPDKFALLVAAFRHLRVPQVGTRDCFVEQIVVPVTQIREEIAAALQCGPHAEKQVDVPVPQCQEHTVAGLGII